MAQHFVSISGGKDSTALYILAVLRGRPFRAVMADTGHEHPLTIEYAKSLSTKTGGPPVEIVKADFSEQIMKKRKTVEETWPDKGISDDIIKKALAALVPTGIPMLDLCLWKGRFPSIKAQFCTEFLKQVPIFEQIVKPAMEKGPVVQWLGVRRDESAARSSAPFFQRVRMKEAGAMLIFRPLINWTADNVFSFSRAHGVEPNPLYLQGMRRVGCFPCIHAGKSELSQIGKRHPWAIDRLMQFESAVKDATERGIATFFAPDQTPEGARMARSLHKKAKIAARQALPEVSEDSAEFKKEYKARIKDISKTFDWPNAEAVFEWSRTSRGGKQFDLFERYDEGVSCSSQYGLCE